MPFCKLRLKSQHPRMLLLPPSFVLFPVPETRWKENIAFPWKTLVFLWHLAFYISLSIFARTKNNDHKICLTNKLPKVEIYASVRILRFWIFFLLLLVIFCRRYHPAFPDCVHEHGADDHAQHKWLHAPHRFFYTSFCWPPPPPHPNMFLNIPLLWTFGPLSILQVPHITLVLLFVPLCANNYYQCEVETWFDPRPFLGQIPKWSKSQKL